MSKTHEEQQRTPSMPAAATAQRELTTADLDVVSGGMPQIHLGPYTTPAMREAQLPWNWQVMAVWNELRRQNGI